MVWCNLHEKEQKADFPVVQWLGFHTLNVWSLDVDLGHRCDPQLGSWDAVWGSVWPKRGKKKNKREGMHPHMWYIHRKMCFPSGASGNESVSNAGNIREVQSLRGEAPLEEGMATHSSILAWRILLTGVWGRLQSEGSQSQTRLKWLNTHACTHTEGRWKHTQDTSYSLMLGEMGWEVKRGAFISYFIFLSVAGFFNHDCIVFV